MSDFKAGFCEMRRCLYPVEGITNWPAQWGRVVGVITIVGLWRLAADCLVWLVGLVV